MTEHPFCSIAARPILTAGLLRCDCGSGAIFAVAPGHDALVRLEQPQHVMLFDDSRPDQPAKGFCLSCWAREFGGPPQIAEAAS